jgi:hypothetical protein
MSDYPSFIIPNHLKFCARSGRRGGHVDARPVVPGTDLCRPCHERFAGILGDIIELWRTLGESIVRRPGTNYMRDRVDSSGGGDAGNLWNPSAARALVEVTDWTSYLVRTIYREHPGTPSLEKDARTDIALATIARWYSHWFTSYPTIGPAVLEDAITYRQAVMQAVDAPAYKRVEIRGHYCQEVLEETDFGPVVCLGQLVGILRPGDTTKPSTIVCSLNPGHPRLDRKDWILAHAH